MMYKCLITGSTGFIGGHLLKYLTDLGYPTEVLTREDWLDKKKTYTKIGDCDVIIHCAWTREKDLHSIEHIAFAKQTIEFFDMCKDLGKRVINLGSSSEYGVKYKPMKETMRCEPINTYGIAKLMVTLYAKKLGYNTLRLFTVVGKGGHSFYDIHKKSSSWGCPTDVRDFTGINIVCKAIERLIHAPHLYSEIINVGTDRNIPYIDITDDSKLVRNDEVDSDKISAKWNKYPQQQYEPRIWRANITKMNKLLNI